MKETEREDKIGYDRVGTVMHYEQCNRFVFDHANKIVCI